MPSTRPTAVAGLFYPNEAEKLAASVHEYVDQANASDVSAPAALIAPHAGYVYSGPVAGTAYRSLTSVAKKISRVVLLGPSHRVPFAGIALSSADAFASPLGPVHIDTDCQRRLAELPGVVTLDAAHAAEHSLEVHLPFLQTVIEDVRLVPLVVGDASPEQVANVIESAWTDDDTLIVVSTDLSHYQSYEDAARLDRETTDAIERRDASITPQQACGCRPLNGLLQVAQRRQLGITTLDLRNSGDTAGPRDRVVGYGAYALA